MEISREAIGRASSSRFARLSVSYDSQGNKMVVCKKSFFAWAVHCVRYRFSSNYRKDELELRESILEGLYKRSTDERTTGFSNVPKNVPYGNRRGFNAYLIDHLNSGNDDSAESFTASTQGEIRPAEGDATPKIGVQPTPEVKAKKVADGKQSWPGGDGVNESFRSKQWPDIVEDGWKNVFQFKGKEQPVEKGQLFLKVTSEVSEALGNRVRGVSSTENCALAHILFTTPRDEQKGLFREAEPIGSENYDAWGFSHSNERVMSSARYRLPNGRLHGAVSALLQDNFKAGSSKTQILKKLDKVREQANEPLFRDRFRGQGISSAPLSEEEFIFCVDAMKNFANAYFDANP